MADHTPTGPVELGAKMDYAEHDRTYAGFVTLAKYGSLFVRSLLSRWLSASLRAVSSLGPYCSS